jgi:hypothetical protein
MPHRALKMFDETIVEAAGGQLVRVPELSAHLKIGDRGVVRTRHQRVDLI